MKTLHVLFCLALAQAAIAADPASGAYCVIDLSGGVATNRFAVSYLDAVPDGGWSEAYRTDRLVLRRVEPPAEAAGEAEDGPSLRAIPERPYYLGVFEVTQRQWELVTGARPSYFGADSCYGSRPVEKVSYDMIRGNLLGAAWPARADVDEGSFMDVLRRKSGLKVDLPTMAQWEHACRAGTLTDYNNGTDRPSGKGGANVDALARYAFNSGYSEGSYGANSDCARGTARVGSYAPNAWGFYDMHGNVMEWCLDSDAAHMVAPGTVEENPAGKLRALCGGAWDGESGEVTSGSRAWYRAAYRFNITGLRVCL